MPISPNGSYTNAYTNPYQMYMYPTQMSGTYQQPMQTQQIQNGGLISAPNEQYARTYPVAPGNSVTFKDESSPYVYVKTASFNQMEQPSFKIYKLVEVENGVNPSQNNQPDNSAQYATKAEYDELRQAYAQLKDTMDTLRKSISLFADKEAMDIAE